jgi:6-phosphogluconate dehydrogenase
MRDLSKYKSLRTEASNAYNSASNNLTEKDQEEFLGKLEDAFYFSMILIYAQGMHLLSKASVTYEYKLNLDDIAKIWRGGCIIRASFLEIIHRAFKTNSSLSHLVLDHDVQSIINKTMPVAREVVLKAIAAGISIPAYTATLSYFDALRSEHMPSNLIQAQRDYFGAHTYELTGMEGSFHTDWEKINKLLS